MEGNAGESLPLLIHSLHDSKIMKYHDLSLILSLPTSVPGPVCSTILQSGWQITTIHFAAQNSLIQVTHPSNSPTPASAVTLI